MGMNALMYIVQFRHLCSVNEFYFFLVIFLKHCVYACVYVFLAEPKDNFLALAG